MGEEKAAFIGIVMAIVTVMVLAMVIVIGIAIVPVMVFSSCSSVRRKRSLYTVYKHTCYTYNMI